MIFLFFRSYFQLYAISFIFFKEKKQKDTAAIWATILAYQLKNSSKQKSCFTIKMKIIINRIKK